MKQVLVTGAQGFIGQHLCSALAKQPGLKVYTLTENDSTQHLKDSLQVVDFIYHLAGVNRPAQTEDFDTVNKGLTQSIVELLSASGRSPAIAFSSSTQAALENPYGLSKKQAEDLLFAYGKKTGAWVYVYRLTNVFGPGCRPNYNSVVATFCHNIANGLEISISNPSKTLELVYVQDVVHEFSELVCKLPPASPTYLNVQPIHHITLGELAEKIYQLHDMQQKRAPLVFEELLMQHLAQTYLSYLPQ